MKIVLGCRVYPTQRAGGMPFVVQDRAHELVRQGFEVHVLTTCRDRPEAMPYEEPVDEYFQDGTEWRKGPTGRCVYVHHLPSDEPTQYSRTWANAARSRLGELNPAVVHLDGFDRNNEWWAGPWRKAVTLHGFGWGGTLSKWQAFLHDRGPKPEPNFDGLKAEAAALRRFDRVLTISNQEHWLAADLYGLGNVDLVYNPIPPQFFQRAIVDPPKARRFLCASISQQEMRCWDFARDVAREAGAEIVQVSNVPRDQMPAIYDSATAVLVLSLFEQGFDLTVAEAQARGRFVICNAVGSYGREAENDRPMITVEPFNRPALLELLRDGNFGVAIVSGENPHEPAVHVREWLKALEI